MDKRSISWLAGLVDGDGSIFVSRRKTGKGHGNYRLLFGVYSVNTDMLAHIHKEFGREARFEPKQNYKLGRVVWEGPQAKEMAALILPYLIGKKEQAKLAQEFPTPGKGCPGVKKSELHLITAAQDKIYLQMRELNRKWSRGKAWHV